jgi:uncharacterized membrane protein YgcG
MPAHTRRAALSIALLFWAFVLAMAPASVRAADIPRLEGPVTDQTGRLSGQVTEVEAAIDRVLADRDVQVFVLFVATTDELNAPDFASETARQNSLGANDALVLVVIDDRTDAIWVADGLRQIDDAEIDSIIADDLEPRLRDGEFAAAAVAAVNGIGEASAGNATPPDATGPVGGGTGAGTGGDGGQPGGDGGLVILGVMLLLVGVALVGWWLWRRRQQLLAAGERDRRTARLARDANALLIATDERIRDAQQEMGFVEAEYGTEEVGPLKGAIAEAQSELKAAFGIRQKLDDGEPEDPPTREQMLNEMVEQLRRAQAALDGQAARIQRLRDLERDAPTVLAALPERITAVEARLDHSAVAAQELAAFAEPTSAPVRGNLEEARKGLAGARDAIAKGQAALAGQDRKAAAHQASLAEQGVTGATTLLDGIDKLASAAREAAVAGPRELAAAEADLASTRNALETASDSAGHDAEFGEAERQIAAARVAFEARPLDPITAQRLAASAHAAANHLLAAVRQDAEQRARLVAAMDAAVRTAQADIERTSDYIATRRGGVGREARTRLAQADEELRRAVSLGATEPHEAIAAAQRAERLAEEAYGYADSDFDRWNSGGAGWGGRQGSDGGAIILGTILGGILSGGGRGGGWGGSPWGSPGPFGGGGGGRSQGGGWGAGGGWGGGGSGGGGRSRGGRW